MLITVALKRTLDLDLELKFRLELGQPAALAVLDTDSFSLLMIDAVMWVQV